MVTKVIINLDLSKASGPDCIPAVVLKNCEPRYLHFHYVIPYHLSNLINTEVFGILLNIYDGTFCKNSSRVLAINYFRKKLHRRYLPGS